MAEIKVRLADDDAASLRDNVYSIIADAVATARKDVTLDQPFFTSDKACYRWLGISYETFKALKLKGLPSHPYGGVSFYNKQEVTQWLLNHSDKVE